MQESTTDQAPNPRSAAEMRAFDALPETIRVMLRDHKHGYRASEVLASYKNIRSHLGPDAAEAILCDELRRRNV